LKRYQTLSKIVSAIQGSANAVSANTLETDHVLLSNYLQNSG